MNWRVADLAPAALGLKLIVAVHVACDTRVTPHVLLEITKSAPFVPVIESPLIEIVVELPFCSVAPLEPPLVPTANDPHERLVGLADTVPVAAVPSPANPMLCLPASLINTRLAVRVPVVVGAKTTVAVQLAEAARLVPHVFV